MVRVTSPELQPMAVQYHCHVIKMEITWPVYVISNCGKYWVGLLNDSKDDFYFFSLSYSYLTIFHSLLPKCRLIHINLFIHLIVRSFQVLHTLILFYLHSPSTFQYLAYTNTVVPKNHLFICPIFPITLTTNITHFSFHPSSHWFLIPNLPIPNFSTANFHPDPNFLFRWYPFQF